MSPQGLLERYPHPPTDLQGFLSPRIRAAEFIVGPHTCLRLRFGENEALEAANDPELCV